MNDACRGSGKPSHGCKMRGLPHTQQSQSVLFTECAEWQIQDGAMHPGKGVGTPIVIIMG